MKRRTKNKRKVVPFTGTYKKPHVCSIKLDPSAAVLAVCKQYVIGGAWMHTAFCAYSMVGTGTQVACTTGARGKVTGTSARFLTSNQSAGS